MCGRSAVATSQPLAAQVGMEILAQGGNAVDAAIATAAALTVVEPVSNGLGSDAFAIVWDGARVHGLNGSGRSPSSASLERLNGAAAVPSLGWAPITVPGAVSSWAALHQRFGSRPFESLLRPAVELARQGYPVSPMCAAAWSRAMERYRALEWAESWRATFAPGGRAPRPGEIVTLPDHAATLEAIARSTGRELYGGALAQAIVRASHEAGGWISRDDLEAHEPLWQEPWSIDFHGASIHEMPPNGQGVAALQAIAICEGFERACKGDEAGLAAHRRIEAVRRALSDASECVADPDLGVERARSLISPESIAAARRAIAPDRAAPQGRTAWCVGGTVYLCAADAGGVMVSFIQSNYEGFGSGVVIPGTGIAMQNRGACFSTEPGHANVYGPSKRPYQTIIPGFITRGGNALAAFGVMGGFMQPQGHLQVVERMIVEGHHPQAALDAPRWQVLPDGRVALEHGLAPLADSLRRRGHRVEVCGEDDDPAVPRPFFGGGQVILRLDSGVVIAGSDFRRDGLAVVR